MPRPLPAKLPEALTAPVTTLSGVGASKAELLAKLEIHSVMDLLLHQPRRYEDRRTISDIRDLEPKQAAVCVGEVIAAGEKRFQRGRRTMFEAIVADDSGRLYLRWWNAPYIIGRFNVGDRLLIIGRVSGKKPAAMDHPEIENLGADGEMGEDAKRIVPIYPLTEGVTQRWMQSLIFRVAGEFAKLIPEPFPKLAPAGMPTRAEAVLELHCPTELDRPKAARDRLAYDEFLELQVEMEYRRRNVRREFPGRKFSEDSALGDALIKSLAFQLTNAQARVLSEISGDLTSGVPMRRLLQGDVGSGKTVVAAWTVLQSIESGCNAVLMAPTEILAEQHFRSFSAWFERLVVPVVLRTANRRGELPTDKAALVVGTHALLSESFDVPDLGMVVIDEQHKFGVGQREQMLRKGRFPHLLVMTATPIPRTLALTQYGDLDYSVIDELPPNRGEVKTYLRAVDRLPKIWSFIRQQVSRGCQAYVVFSRIDESEEDAIHDLTVQAPEIQRALGSIRTGVVHGRMKLEERESVMTGFRNGRIKVLLATTVIEVGVDVPSANIMVILNAERYGLAQLHQLRGRVGRGKEEGWCILVAEPAGEEAELRLQTMCETNDGFLIAERDLEMRGAGRFLGTEQSGAHGFRFADLCKDRALLDLARKMARAAL